MEKIKIEKNHVRRAFLGVRIEKEEREAMEKICEQQGVNYSEFVRFAISEVIKKTAQPLIKSN